MELLKNQICLNKINIIRNINLNNNYFVLHAKKKILFNYLLKN